MDCVFCKIIKGEIPSYIVYEDEIVKVFLDIHPSADGHMLIVPKKHFLDITDIDVKDLNHTLDISKKMYQLIKEKLHADGLTISQNNGYGQDVKHFHIHLTPRYKNDNIQHIYPTDKKDIKEVFEILTK